MREIKFRGKAVDNGEWIYGWVFGNNAKSIIEIDKEYPNEYGVEAYYTSVVIPETVGQYTGLKDKNGVEIYEGDICRCLDSYGENYYISDINYNGGAFSVEVGGCNYDYTALGWALENNDINEIEIIGNIYEHSELITQKEGKV